jgi:hypothetical protein
MNGNLVAALVCATAAFCAWFAGLHDGFVILNALVTALNLYCYMDK